jgi:Protein of unknown function (DUF1588)
MKRIKAFLLVATASVVAPACDPGVNDPNGGGGSDGSGGSGSDGSGSANDEWNQALDKRVTDYSAALRIAALRLTGDLPTRTEINAVATAGDDAAKKAAYETLVDAYIARPTFGRQMMVYFRDTFKMGGTAMLDTAPAFAAKLAVDNDDYRKLLTATNGTCTTFNAGNNTFAAADCANGVTTHAGVLTNPGVMAQFDSNFAFRRVRWVEETFNCDKFPTAISETTETYGGKIYNGKFPWTSFAGKDNGGRIDFHDTSAIVCGNCHNVINHVAPLFANFDATGQLTGAIAVLTPLGNNDLARATDFLPNGEPTAYRAGVPAPTIPALGAAMAVDPEIASCAVKRVWNWALGKTDIVNDLTLVPDAVVESQVAAFTQNGFKLKDLIRAVYVADDFTKF